MRRLKFVVGDMAVVNTRARRDLRGRTGVIVQVGPTKGEYGVEFGDGRMPSLAYIEAVTLDSVANASAHPVRTPGTRVDDVPVREVAADAVYRTATLRRPMRSHSAANSIVRSATVRHVR